MDLKFYYFDENHQIKNRKDYKIIKVTLLGQSGIGKTQLVDRLITSNYIKFNEQAKELHQTPLNIELEVKYQNKKFILHIQDTSGYERYSYYSRIYCKFSDIILIFYDSLNNTFPSYSYDKANYWIRLAMENAKKDTIFGLIRIKYDNNIIKKEEEGFVPDEELLEYENKNNFFFCHLGIFQKYETGVKELIKKLIHEYVKKINK